MSYWESNQTAAGWKNGIIHNPSSTPFSEKSVGRTGPAKSANNYGWRNPLPYLREDKYRREMAGSTSSVFQGQIETYTGNLYGIFSEGMPLVTTSVSSSLRSRAEVAALLKLKAQDFNLAQAYGERQQTINLVASNIGKIAGAFGDIRRGNVSRALSRFGIRAGRGVNKSPMSLQKAGSTWLELQYGWKPLVSDIYGAADYLNRFDRYDPSNYGVTVKAKIQELIVNRNDKTHQQVGRGGWDEDRVVEKKVFVRLDYIPANVQLQDFSSLGVANPAALAWELLPFSFVVDWAIPIGDWLSAFDAGLGFNFRAGSRSELARATVRRVTRSGNGYWGTATGFSQYFKLERIPYSQPPSVMTTFPGFKNPFSLTHLANSMALLVTNFGAR